MERINKYLTHILLVLVTSAIWFLVAKCEVAITVRLDHHFTVGIDEKLLKRKTP